MFLDGATDSTSRRKFVGLCCSLDRFTNFTTNSCYARVQRVTQPTNLTKRTTTFPYRVAGHAACPCQSALQACQQSDETSAIVH